MRWLFLTLFLLSVPSDARAEVDRCEASTGTLHLVGDSQCAGSTLYASRIPETKQWASVKGTCKGGTRVPYWNDHIGEAQLKPNDAVVIYLGSNDWGKPDPTAILTAIKASHASCVWVGPPLIRGNDNGVADHLKKMIEADGTCKFLDSRPLHIRQEDGVHPGPEEHKRWLRAALSKMT
jgi:lysophospholipase L1-like esterase